MNAFSQPGTIQPPMLQLHQGGKITDNDGKELWGEDLVEQIRRIVIGDPNHNPIIVALALRIGMLEARLEKL